MDIFKNIEFVGMLCMGAFVGGVLNYGLSKIKDDNSFSKIVTTIFGAAFSGVVFVFLEKLADNPSVDSRQIYMYPIGLILALLWAQIPNTIEKRIKAENVYVKVIGIIHFIGVSGITIYLIFKIFAGDKINTMLQ
ncbi:hypothetical protein ABN763_04360 [Spongiivirga sp. MCCC 1A20706]|uniref:hypothetical protein n=1 Tax=Spongiivirga sp. MCCC 1A20706 TaxID=3160963 RepID=UPI003977C875